MNWKQLTLFDPPEADDADDWAGEGFDKPYEGDDDGKA